MSHFPGHYEMFQTANRLLRLAAAGVCVSIPVSMANAQEARARILLTPAQVVSVMHDRQLPTRGAQVRLAAPITAGIANPPLEIQAITLLSAHEMRLRIACRDRSECLPFFAIATYPEDINLVTLPVKPEYQPAGSEQLAPATNAVAEMPVASASASKAGPGKAPILHSGSPATLDFDGDRVHVRIEVICLEGGAAGDKIRVTTHDHKQIYVAKIVTPTLLKGTF